MKLLYKRWGFETDKDNDMYTLFLGDLCAVFIWYGLGAMKYKYNYGIVNPDNLYPTIYVGCGKIVTGPGLEP